MSHSKERKEKICLNCGAALYGRYCHACGQENIEPKETFWHMLTHFAYDITHFDGKFFSTLKYLLFRPGFISHEYLKGRRMGYLHPIRMYVFTSAFFFLIYFSFYQKEPIQTTTTGPISAVIEDLKKEKSKFEKKLLQAGISDAEKERWTKRVENLASDIAMLQADSTKTNELKSSMSTFVLGDATGKFRNFAAYDSAQKRLPEKDRDGWLDRAFEKRNFDLQEKYKGDGNAILKAIINDFRHRFPQMLFISLPILALIFQLLYRRKNKQFYYANHIIHCIHLYCATFIIILVSLWLGSIFHWFHASTPTWLSIAFVLATFYYWFRSMLMFYEQGIGKTLLKFILLIIMSTILMFLVFIAFGIFSTLTI